MDIFHGRKLVIATKHHKEKVIAKKVASTLGVLPFVPSDLDTDQFGTFSGEIERILNPLESARRKCELALQMTGCDLAIASEGSFGPHPSLMFVPANEELVVLIDKKNNIEIVGKSLSTETNFNGQRCTNEKELLSFAEKVNFPSHGLILRSHKEATDNIFKGICDKNDLLEKFQSLITKHGHAFVETDMRALYNPSRMEVISEATDAMIEKAIVCCQQCDTPGFGITNVERGLPCGLCGEPTKSVKAYVLSCNKCGHSTIEPLQDKSFEDPMYCDYCNP